MTDTVDLLEPVLSDLAGVVARTDADGSAPTPCPEYDVAALRGHVAGWLATFAGGFADPDGRAPSSTPDVPPAPADAAAMIRASAAELADAVRAGAVERPLYLGENGMPGDLALSMILWEYLVHGWDLATATGQPWSPDPVASEAALAFAPGMLTDDHQGPGKAFGPRVDVAADAPAIDRLVGMSGRDPGWQPPVG